MQYTFSQFAEPGSLILREPKAIVCFSRDGGTPAGNHISNCRRVRTQGDSCFPGSWSIRKQCVLSAQRPSNFQIVIKLNAHLVHPLWRTTLESSLNACGRNRTGHWPGDVPELAQDYTAQDFGSNCRSKKCLVGMCGCVRRNLRMAELLLQSSQNSQSYQPTFKGMSKFIVISWYLYSYMFIKNTQ